MELIKIREEYGRQLVSGRELHEFLDVKSKYADWIKNRIKKIWVYWVKWLYNGF